MIHLLWPTIRPIQMEVAYKHWHSMADKPDQIVLTIAVNTEEHKSQISESLGKIVVDDTKPGVVHAVNILSHNLNGPNDDIVILASDDMFAPEHWDTWLQDTLRGKTVGLRVNDGYNKQDAITIPIMTMGCLRKLNMIIYHKSYIHQYSDTELYFNLNDLNLLLDVWDSSPIFEHRHWVCNKRQIDEHDQFYAKVVGQDASNWSTRSKLPASERLH